jgi:hypothetical protein
MANFISLAEFIAARDAFVAKAMEGYDSTSEIDRRLAIIIKQIVVEAWEAGAMTAMSEWRDLKNDKLK